MKSLLLDGVLPDQAAIINSCFDEHWGLGVLALVFVLLATLTVMNMLVGVLCEVVSVVSTVEKEELIVNYVQSALRKLYAEFTGDIQNPLSKDCFEKLLGKEQ